MLSLLAAISGSGIAQIFGAIMEGLGRALGALYSVTHSYALAIILVTVGVRALLLPLTIKSTRGMAAMQKAQPEIKKVQEKYKALQRKARDRAEVQQIRMDMQREMNETMRSHGASLGAGCLPQVAQFPVLIAMFSVMRAAIPVEAAVATPIAAGTFDTNQKKAPVCRPVDPSTQQELVPSANAPTPTSVKCVTAKDPAGQVFGLNTSELKDLHDPDRKWERAGWIARCRPAVESDGSAKRFICESALGAGHLPIESRLFEDVSADRATILGMHPGCTASQAASKESAHACTTDPRAAGGSKAIPYYLLIGLVVASSYYQGRQMNQRLLKQGSEITQQQKTMSWMMPALFGFISLSLPAGTNFYYLFFNLWQIGQQHVQFGRQTPKDGAPQQQKERAPEPVEKAPAAPVATAEGTKPPGRPQGSKKKRKRKKRR